MHIREIIGTICVILVGLAGIAFYFMLTIIIFSLGPLGFLGGLLLVVAGFGGIAAIIEKAKGK